MNQHIKKTHTDPIIGLWEENSQISFKISPSFKKYFFPQVYKDSFLFDFKRYYTHSW